MNRGKYIGSADYREGYEDARKDTAITIINMASNHCSNIMNELSDLIKNVRRIIDNEETDI